MTLILPRRQFLKTLSGIIAAPAIVRADNLMKVVAPALHVYGRSPAMDAFPDMHLLNLNEWRYLIRIANIVVTDPTLLEPADQSYER